MGVSLSKKRTQEDTEEIPPTSRGSLPELKANPFSRLFFQWIQPILSTGYKRTLETYDLYDLDERFESKKLAEELQKAWMEQKGSGTKPSLLRAMNAVYGRVFWPTGLLKLMADVSTVVSPLMLTEITKYVKQSNDFYVQKKGVAPNDTYGFAIPFILFAIQEIGTLSNQHYFHIMTMLGIKIRAALITTIYRKSMVLSGKARQEFTAGKITNMMSTDTSRIEMSAVMLHGLWVAPLAICIALALLIVTIGPAALAGFAILILALPLQAIAMRSLIRYRRQGQLITDKRVKLTQEILQGMRVIKFFAWEPSFLKKLVGVRNEELRFARLLLIVRTAVQTIALALPIMASIIALIVFAATSDNFTPTVVFTALALFNSIRIPLMFVPMVIGMATDALVSVRRLESLFDAEELESLPEIDRDIPYAIEVKGAEFEWDAIEPSVQEEKQKSKKEKLKKEKSKKENSKKDERKSKANAAAAVVVPTETDATLENEVVSLKKEIGTSSETNTVSSTPGQDLSTIGKLCDINLQIPRGEIVAIVGPVGSGKSSLLNALVSEMRKIKGEIVFGGSVGYCPQTAWIQNATVKQNILFGMPYDERKYKEVLRVCALEADLAMLPDGDETEIGERGVTLSGGQKQRLNIARAVYYDTDIVLLDDPLSAVDSHVGRHLFEKCFLGTLKDKTRILVTHQLHFLPQVDRVIVMERGRMVECGTFKELMQKNGTFCELMRSYGGAGDEEEAEVIEIPMATDDRPVTADGSLAPQQIRLRVTKTREEPPPTATAMHKELMTKEERATGAVGGGVYWIYVKAAGGFIAAFTILSMLILSQLSRVATDLWLSWWSGNTFQLSQGVSMGGYAALGIVQAIFNMLSALSVAIFGLVAAKNLHNNAIGSLLKAPMMFFDTTPLGRIINRFSKDVDATDFILADSFRMFLVTLFTVMSTFIFICVIFPVFLAPLVPMLIVYYYFQKYYRSTARELKRLDSISRSPLYAHFSESLTGLSTLRAYRVQPRFQQVNERMTDDNTKAYMASIIIQRWLGARLETIANILTFFVMLFAVLSRTTLSPAIVGLIISYSLQIAGIFNWVVRQSAEVETNMNSVERLDHYIEHLEHEAPAEIPGQKPPENWPDQGEIKFRNLEMRYRPELPLVLHGINFEVRGGEKVSVVGRTGSGKSSIMMTLFRIVEASGGSIEIDGVNIANIGLADLRRRLAIIPQDPILFNGTVRFNLDPFGEHTDQEIWDALQRADMKSYVSEQPGGLDAEIAEGGENVSAGQRQLLCLARAMLIRAKILVMDEATASVDLKTDALLQRAIREDFAGCTILTIAHRLNTVIDYDRVLVLDNGRIKEYDTPKNLLEDESSAFTAMVNETGEKNAAMLKAIARGEAVVDAFEAS